MNPKLNFENSTLQTLFSKEEFSIFEQIVQESAKDFSEIQGVLITGSLVQRIRLPDPMINNQFNKLQQTYEQIVCRSKRKSFPHIDSDLDIWLLIDDVEGNENIPQLLDQRAQELIEWYSKQENIDLYKWIEKKHNAFDAYYKQLNLYPKSWTKNNEIPYFGWGFKETLIDNVGCGLKPVRDRIKCFFNKNYPRDFLEIRAFPSVVFNLRPEKIMIKDGLMDRTPFPYFMKDWLDLYHNCIILYDRNDKEEKIYPFNEDGLVRGQSIANWLNWDYNQASYCISKRKRDTYEHISQ